MPMCGRYVGCIISCSQTPGSPGPTLAKNVSGKRVSQKQWFFFFVGIVTNTIGSVCVSACVRPCVSACVYFDIYEGFGVYVCVDMYMCVYV